MTSIAQGSRLASTAAAALLLAVLGCSGGSTVNVLEGRITYKGADVTGGTINFYPASGGPIPGFIKPDGTYVASDVPPGEVTVTIETESVKNTGKPTMPAGGKAPPGGDAGKYPGGAIQGAGAYVRIPLKYGDRKQSPLKFDVGKGKIAKDFELID